MFAIAAASPAAAAANGMLLHGEAHHHPNGCFETHPGTFVPNRTGRSVYIREAPNCAGRVIAVVPKYSANYTDGDSLYMP
jgi:hypothetical protein